MQANCLVLLVTFVLLQRSIKYILCRLTGKYTLLVLVLVWITQSIEYSLYRCELVIYTLLILVLVWITQTIEYIPQ